MKTEIRDGQLHITIPISADAIRTARPSATGKTRIVATSGGFMRLDGAPHGAALSLNLTLTTK